MGEVCIRVKKCGAVAGSDGLQSSVENGLNLFIVDAFDVLGELCNVRARQHVCLGHVKVLRHDARRAASAHAASGHTADNGAGKNTVGEDRADGRHILGVARHIVQEVGTELRGSLFNRFVLELIGRDAQRLYRFLGERLREQLANAFIFAHDPFQSGYRCHLLRKGLDGAIDDGVDELVRVAHAFHVFELAELLASGLCAHQGQSGISAGFECVFKTFLANGFDQRFASGIGQNLGASLTDQSRVASRRNLGQLGNLLDHIQDQGFSGVLIFFVPVQANKVHVPGVLFEHIVIQGGNEVPSLSALDSHLVNGVVGDNLMRTGHLTSNVSGQVVGKAHGGIKEAICQLRNAHNTFGQRVDASAQCHRRTFAHAILRGRFRTGGGFSGDNGHGVWRGCSRRHQLAGFVVEHFRHPAALPTRGRAHLRNVSGGGRRCGRGRGRKNGSRLGSRFQVLGGKATDEGRREVVGGFIGTAV